MTDLSTDAGLATALKEITEWPSEATADVVPVAAQPQRVHGRWFAAAAAVVVVVGGLLLLTRQGGEARFADASWSSMAESPLAPRFEPAVVWTGEEMLVIGGYDRSGREFDDGAAFDPVTNSWRPIAALPSSREQRTGAGVGQDGFSTRLAFDGVWFEGEAVLRVGGVGPGFWDFDLWAYSPDTDGWRVVSEVRFDQLDNDELVMVDGSPPIPTLYGLTVGRGELVAYGWRSDLNSLGHVVVDAQTGTWGEFVPIPDSGDLYAFNPAVGSPLVIDDRYLVDLRSRGNNIDGPLGYVVDLDTGLSSPIPFPPVEGRNPVMYVEGTIGASGRWVGAVLERTGDDENFFVGASYVLDPATASWTPAPTVGGAWNDDSHPTIVDAGTADVAFGGLDLYGGTRSEVGPVVAAFAEGADAWEALPDPEIEIARQGHAMIWTGDVVIVYGGAVVDPDRSVNIAAVPLNDGAMLRLPAGRP